MVRLQEELIGVKLREAEALTGLKEQRQQIRDLEDHWQVRTSTSNPRAVGQNVLKDHIESQKLYCERQIGKVQKMSMQTSRCKDLHSLKCKYL